jgi:hypothetical protein
MSTTLPPLEEYECAPGTGQNVNSNFNFMASGEEFIMPMKMKDQNSEQRQDHIEILDVQHQSFVDAMMMRVRTEIRQDDVITLVPASFLRTEMRQDDVERMHIFDQRIDNTPGQICVVGGPQHADDHILYIVQDGDDRRVIPDVIMNPRINTTNNTPLAQPMRPANIQALIASITLPLRLDSGLSRIRARLERKKRMLDKRN